MRGLLFVLLVLGWGVTACGADAAFRLVRNGAPAATIVVDATAGKLVRFAAAELQTHVERISGAKLPLATTADTVAGPRILLGRSAETERLGIAIPSGFTPALAEEGYVLQVVGDALVAAGNDDGPALQEDPKDPYSFPTVYKGTLFAVYDLLERLGCRWYYPGDFGTCLPEARDLAVPALDVRAKPSFPVRGFWYGLPASRRNNAQLTADMDLWMLRNRFLPYGSVLPSAGDGSVMAPFRKNKVEKIDGKRVVTNLLFVEHPEYFAQRADGSRDEAYLCLSNPEVVRLAAVYAREYFRTHPEATGFGYAPPDGAPTCECADCRAANLGLRQKPPADPRIQDISEGFYRFLNAVAREVKKEFPDKWVTTTAYSGRIRPPEATVLSENISVHLALLGYAEHHRLDFPGWQTREKRALYERWGALSRFSVERPYYPPMQFHCHVPQPMYRAHAFNVQELKRMGFAGAEWEARCAFMAEGLNIYVLGKCLWDVNTDVEALLDEHYRRFYGPASARVRAWYDGVEQLLTTAPVEHHEEERLPEIYPPAKVVQLTEALGDLEGTARAASPLARQRVRFARLVADHFRAYSEMRHLEAALDFAGAAREARRMIALEQEIDAIHPAMIDGYAEQRDSAATYGELGANASPHGKLKQYLAKQAMLDGTKGELAAALPVAWEFAVDPRDSGLIAQWYRPGNHGGPAWRPIDTTRTMEPQGWQDADLQGYDGYCWYRITFTVPERFAGRPLRLFIGALNDQGWFWVNGHYAGTQPFHQYWMRWKYHHEVDITPFVHAGENTLVVRVYNEQSFGGIFRRSFVYAPK